MKSKYITHIILEGCDGVGKDTICKNLWRKYDFKQRVYVRGEISDYVYSKKYNRPFISTQRGLPFLYVVLIGDEKEIKNHIIHRPLPKGENLDEELAKIKDNSLFEKAVDILKLDYHIIKIYCEKKSIIELVNEIYEKTIDYINNLSIDPEINEFNKLYKKGCEKCGIELKVRGNQPFFNNNMIMCDAHLHNGEFETYSDKRCPHNLIFSLAYNPSEKEIKSIKKTIDFCYPINSKILMRPEVYEYFNEFEKNNISFLTADSKYIPNYNMCIRMEKCFGNNYIKSTAKSRATIYTSRDLIDIKMITVRPYEATLADQIIFVDEITDPDNEILTQIYNDDSMYSEICLKLLRVNPQTICQNYNEIIHNKFLVSYILEQQHKWYDNLKNNLLKGEIKNENKEI